MVAVVRGGDGDVRAIHRTYLTPEGGKAPVEPVRMMLGPTGGGAVRLPGGHVVDLIAVTEGIEDGLRIRDQLGCETWAGLSASGITNIEVPRRVRRVILVPDCDGVGWAATGALERRLVANGVQVQRRWAR
jgi:putative DNA primase/helicase